jgi:ADP-L-glycero-D-manno-heptose 6-epimerase
MELFRSYHPDYADGEFMRDFLYVKDAVAMVLHLFDCGATGLYNVGSGRAETWNALATAAFEAMGKPVNIKYIDMPESLRDRYQYYTCTEIDKLRNTGYTAEVGSLKDSIRDMICNYLIPGKYLGD